MLAIRIIMTVILAIKIFAFILCLGAQAANDEKETMAVFCVLLITDILALISVWILR